MRRPLPFAWFLLLIALAGCDHGDDDNKISMTGTQSCTITVNGVPRPCSP